MVYAASEILGIANFGSPMVIIWKNGDYFIMNLKNIKAIIFDMDGVIVDSEKLHFQSERETCDFFGINAPLEVWDEFRGTTAKRFWHHLVENYGNGGIDMDELVEYNYRKYIKLAEEKLELVAGALEFIKEAKKKFEKLAVATSGRKISQENVFNKFGLHDFFDAVITGDQVENGKPHPEPYLKTSELLGFEPHECLVIEDSDNGIKSAKAAGCYAVGITTTFNAQRLREAGADKIIANLQEFSEIM